MENATGTPAIVADADEDDPGFAFPPPLVDEMPTAAGTEVAEHRPLDFPPLANSYVVGVATAEVLDAEGLRQLDPDDADTLARATELMAFATAQANDTYFRFDLREVHEPREPRPRRFARGDEYTGLSEERSTRKLTLLLVHQVDTPSGECTLSIPAIGKQVTVTTGTLVIVPAYVVTRFDLADGESVSTLVSHANGNAFR